MKEGLISRTAMLIAASQLLAAQKNVLSRYVESEAISISQAVLQKSGLRGALLLGLIQSKAGRYILQFFEWLLLPGLPAHFVLRKHLIRQQVEQAVQDGASRLIVVAAGFDALAYRMSSQHPALTVAEIDFPSTQAFKISCLSTLPPCANLLFRSADLSQQSMTSLLIESQQPKATERFVIAHSVIVIEGLTMYLSAAKVRQLLADARTLAGDGGKVVCTFMVPSPEQRIAFHNANPLVKHLLRLWREPFTWGATKTDFEVLALALGYANIEFFTTQGFASSIKFDKQVAVGEVIAKLSA